MLEQLLDSWFGRLEAGEVPDPAQHCAAHPELSAEFLRLLERAKALDALFEPRARATVDSVPPPERLGEFELIAPIGRGGVGQVWLARQTSLRRLVALKIVRNEGDARNQRRLRREAEVAASLDHPGIVPIYAVGDHGANAWIAMKWLTGPSLDAVGAPLPPERAARIAASVARALHEAHRAGIVHRDVKPSNVVLDGEQPCLVDFGLARDADDVSRTTVVGHVSGTLLYMSPEHLRSGGTTSTLDARTDVYSLGATLYELLCGHPPFVGDHPGKVIHAILESDPEPLPVPRDLATIVLRALDKDRERRFPTALEMATELERYLAGEPIRSRPIGFSTRVWKLARRNRTATTTIVATLLVAVGLGSLLAWNTYERGRLLESGVSRVQEAILTGDVKSARVLLAQLLAEAPDATEVVAASRQLSACLALDELLDRVQALPEDADPAELRSVAQAIDPDDLPAARRLEHALAAAFAQAITGDYAAARSRVEALPDGRARDALRAAVATAENGWQGPEDWQLQPGTSPAEHLFTVLAMRFAQRPLTERRAEIDLARRLDAADWRLRLQHAVQLVNEKSHRRALEALGGLPRGTSFPRIVRRLMMFEAIRLGDHAEARLHLHTFLVEHDRSTWSAADAAYVLEACYWLDEPAEDVLEFARTTWPDDIQVTVLAARALHETDPIAAAKLLSAGMGMARTQAQRETAELTAHRIAVAHVMPFWVPWNEEIDPPTRTLLQDLAMSAGTLAARTRRDEVRLAASLLQARAQFACLDVAAARRTLSGLDAAEPVVVLELAHHAYFHYLMAACAQNGIAAAWQMDALASVRVATATDWREHVWEIRPRLASALGQMPRGELLHGQPAGPMGWLLAALLALAAEDLPAAKTAAEAARTSLRDAGDDWRRELLRYVDDEIRRR